jgi:hypothetical protein
MVDDKLRRDEIERAENLEQIKSDVHSEVRSEIAADTAAMADRERCGRYAKDGRVRSPANAA